MIYLYFGILFYSLKSTILISQNKTKLNKNYSFFYAYFTSLLIILIEKANFYLIESEN